MLFSKGVQTPDGKEATSSNQPVSGPVEVSAGEPLQRLCKPFMQRQ